MSPDASPASETSNVGVTGARLETAGGDAETAAVRPDWACLFDLPLHFLAIGDYTGRFHFLNTAWETTLGYSREEMLARRLSEFVHEDDQEATAAQLERLRRGETVTRYENRLRCRDGSLRWLAWCAVPDVARGLVYALADDVTERKQAEAALHEREQRLASIFRAVPVGIGVTVNRVTREVNGRLCEMLGYSREELIGLPARVLYLTEAEFDRVGREKYAQIAERGIGSVETRWRRKDGGIIDVLLSSSPIDPADLLKGVTYTAMDITQRKATEAALRFQAILLDQIQDRVTATDLEGRIVYVNQAECDGVGRTREELIGQSVELYGDDPARGGTQREIIEATRTQGSWRGEVVNRRADGMELVMDCRTWLVRDDQGQPAALCGVSTDVTQRKRDEAERAKLQAQLQQAQKLEAIGQLAGGVAHDFNNVLTAVLGHVELAEHQLEAAGPGAEGLRQALQQISRCAHRATSLTRQLLAFSRRQVMQPEVLDLNRVVEDVRGMLVRLITENVALQIFPGKELQYVLADPGQIEQVIVNLVVNARDAMPNGGKLAIETGNVVLDEEYVRLYPEARVGPHVLLAVSDTGCGMDTAVRERVFEPFFTTKPPGQGTGLGLSTVYGVVRQMGGHVTVYSEPGQGSSFKVYLPAAPGRVAASPRPTRVEAPLTGGGERVLVCEDDEAVRHLAVKFLQAAGYDVHATDCGEAAKLWAQTQGAPVRLLVTDVIMPDVNGRVLADDLRRRWPDLRVLFISGYSASVIAHHGVLEAGLEFLEKPFSRSDLLRRVREVLNHPS